MVKVGDKGEGWKQHVGKAIMPKPSEEKAAIVVNMDAAYQAVDGWLVVGRLISAYRANPKAIIDGLKPVWRLHGDAAVQRTSSENERFIVKFQLDGDRHFVLKGGPWTHKGDVVIFAKFDGKGKAADVKLDAMRIWVQIRDLPYPLMKVEMGWLLGGTWVR
jgi:hypothetical protein